MWNSEAIKISMYIHVMIRSLEIGVVFNFMLNFGKVRLLKFSYYV